MTKPIKMTTIILRVQIPQKEVKKCGGREKYRALLWDILERYATSEYFDLELIDEN